MFYGREIIMVVLMLTQQGERDSYIDSYAMTCYQTVHDTLNYRYHTADTSTNPNF